MNNQTKMNPYELDHGYETRHDYAITGYGITIKSILYWLFENHLNTEETGFPYEDNMEEDYDAFFDSILTNRNISYVQTSNADVEAIMMYDVSASETKTTIPDQATIKAQIVKVVMGLYQIPIKKQASLTKFIEEYTSYINIVDYC